MRTCRDCGTELPKDAHGNQKFCVACAYRHKTSRRDGTPLRHYKRLHGDVPGIRRRETDLKLVYCPDVSWQEGLTFGTDVLRQIVTQFPEGARFEDRRGRRFEVFKRALVPIGGRDVLGV